MQRNKPRKNHYVPEMLLKRFCAPDGYLRVNNGSKIYQSGPRDVFEERDLNATRDVIPSATGDSYSVKLSYEHEDTLSEIEGNAEPVIQQIIEQAQKLRCPRLSPEQQNAWKLFFMAMSRRTPEAQEEIWSEVDYRDEFYKAAQMIAEKDGFPLPEKDALLGIDGVVGLEKTSEHNFKARFSSGSHPVLQDTARSFARSADLLMAVIPFSGKNFVIGSRGLAIVDESAPDDLMRGHWLPVSPNVAICAKRLPDVELLVCLDDNRGGNHIIDTINNASASRSWAIAGHSEELVRSLKPSGRKS
jgi:hypothetical protein